MKEDPMPTNVQYTEREMLIRHGEILKTICNQLKELKEENTTEHDDLKKKLDKVNDDKVSNTIFFWVIGFIIVALISLTTYTGTLKNEVVKNIACIESIEKDLNHTKRGINYK